VKAFSRPSDVAAAEGKQAPARAKPGELTPSERQAARGLFLAGRGRLDLCRLYGVRLSVILAALRGARRPCGG
jgi:hypothetical protein